MGLMTWLGKAPSRVAAQSPVVTSIVLQNDSFVVSASVPAGFKHAVLEAGRSIVKPERESLIAGGLTGDPAIVTFRVPNSGAVMFLQVRAGTSETVPPSTHSGSQFFSASYMGGGTAPLSNEEKTGHVLSRLAYGPSMDDTLAVNSMGVAAYVARQLQPETIDDSSNTELNTAEADLFTIYQPGDDTALVQQGDVWQYFKGTQAPPTTWKEVSFQDNGWLQGPTGIGYGDEDDATVLEDMRQADGNTGYLTVYLRKSFTLATSSDVDALILRVDYDDGFVAYLNGSEIARANVEGSPPLFDEPSPDDHEAGVPVEFDLSGAKALLRAGENVLAVEVHNVSRTSSDLTIIPELISRKFLPIPPQKRINGIDELQELIHVRGVYSKRQLQAVLAEFWENHFTTDYDKVADYFSDLRNSDAEAAMSEAQAEAEAAQVEYLEYQFFYDHALGNFGDLLLFSATSPSQLIYLDNVLNVKGAANENYAREILELFAFGVDNRYLQRDIEELARCFTGWTVRKVWPEEVQPFPASARTPPTEESVRFEDTVILDVGPGWKYVKGIQEPSPDGTGAPTTAWAEAGFNDTAWLTGATSIGYGDDDDATVLDDMRQNYSSVYLRREFTIGSPSEVDNLLLSIDYDDGFVAYLNGAEIARSRTMRETGTPPAHDTFATGNHEAGRENDEFSLGQFLALLKPAPEKNVLAIQAHNVSLSSSDFSIHPRLVQRRLLPGSIENGDINGVWTFRFDPEEHDTDAKVIFRGTPYEMNIPEGRTGTEGLRDALDAIDSFVNHPSVSEFICLKLINKFVSDEISLTTYKDGSAPEELRRLMDEAIEGWHSTQPAGNIKTVLDAILSPATQNSHFWSRDAYRSKVKTPVEFINSSVRALQARVSGTRLPTENDELGMHLFTRDEPDGWSELGVDWIDTGTMLARIKFAQSLATDRVTGLRWDVAAWANANNLTTAESIVNYFDQLLFRGQMSPSNRALLIEFANTNDQGEPQVLDPQRNNYETRVRELVGVILSMPQWHFQ